MTEKEMVDEIILNSRLSNERMDKLFERLERCEDRLRDIAQDLARLEAKSIQSFQYPGPTIKVEPDILGAYNRYKYEDSMAGRT